MVEDMCPLLSDPGKPTFNKGYVSCKKSGCKWWRTKTVNNEIKKNCVINLIYDKLIQLSK